MPTVSSRLQQWMIANGIKPIFFAARIGISESTFRLWLRNKRKPQLKFRALIEKETNGYLPASTWEDEWKDRRKARRAVNKLAWEQKDLFESCPTSKEQSG